jgi:uncharacterized membrane protein YkvI
MTLRRLPAWVYAVISLVPALILLFFVDQFDTLSVIGLSIAAIFWASVFSYIHWKRLDEPARVANKVAWAHGGVIGLFVAVVSVPVVHFLPAAGDQLDRITSSWSSRWSGAEAGFALGVLATGILQMAGFMIAWAGWWLRRR